MSEAKRIANYIYWKLVDRTLPKQGFILDNISRLFSHKTFPYDVTLEWVKQFMKKMLEYYETCKPDSSWYNLYVGDRDKYFYQHYSPRAYSKEELEAIIKTLQEAIRNSDVLAQIHGLAKEMWLSGYPKEWDRNVTEDITLGELLVRLEDLQPDITLGHVAAITGLTVRQVQNSILPMLIEEGFEFEAGRPRSSARKAVKRLVKWLLKQKERNPNS